ncbi:hypothetical protein ACFWDI_35530 [Streptomyces sp. NPDC060064]|uniref:hypothetical protein n=1 Tax=Streptomyces sp. NPDC060064 TaxID=3347049 RepID=UPI0036913661
MTDSPEQEPATPGSPSQRIGAPLAWITPLPNRWAPPACLQAIPPTGPVPARERELV